MSELNGVTKAVKFLKDCGVFYIASCDNTVPHLRPFGAVTEYNGKAYITTGSNKHVFKQMITNPSVEIAATAEDGSWIRIAARVSVVVNTAVKQAVIDDYPGIIEIYKGREEFYTVLSLDDASVQIYSNGRVESFIFK